LRFDFNSKPLSKEQLAELEQLVNERVVANDVVSWIEVPFEEISKRDHIMQFFGEKYGNTVRVVQIGGNAGRLDGYSMELCGGTHVLRTGQLGLFKIISEGAIQAGVRRVEAHTALGAYRYVNELLTQQNSKIDELQTQLLDLKKSIEKERARADQQRAGQIAESFNLACSSIVEAYPDANGDFLQALVNVLKTRQYPGVGVFFGSTENQIPVAVYVGKDAASRFHAGKLVGEITALLGGKGGGRPDVARGVGLNKESIQAALEKTRLLIAP
jgi:alanyl-tRNA synthetase